MSLLMNILVNGRYNLSNIHVRLIDLKIKILIARIISD